MKRLLKVMLLSMYFSLTSTIWILLMLLYSPFLLVVLAIWSLATWLGEESQRTFFSMEATVKREDST